VAFADQAVREVLELEEKRLNWAFVSRSMPLGQVVHLFAVSRQLEAAQVTENGRATERLLVIVTRYDVAGLPETA
jgi:hypothetical protein